MPPHKLLKRSLNLLTDRIHTLPVLVLFPHSRCNCRCVMCDIWKNNGQIHQISVNEVKAWVNQFQHLGVRWVMLSGGEALMHSDMFALCRVLRNENIRVTVHSTGLLLKKYSRRIVEDCTDVIVSLDGSKAVHDQIRNIPRAFERLVEGVSAVKSLAPDFRVTGRCVIQKLNYTDLGGIIDAAGEIGLDQISFLGADVSSQAFNRPEPWDQDQMQLITLDPDDVIAFRSIVQQVIADRADAFSTQFIVESPEKLTRIVDYYAALNGDADFPTVTCNAPWVSSVVEADGTVRPCFFHKPFGNIYDMPLDAILNSVDAIRFRKDLDVTKDSTCRRCVCTLNLNPIAKV